MSFEWIMVLPFLIAALTSSLKAVGDLTLCQKINDLDWKRPEMKSIGRGLLADAIGVIGAGLLGGVGTSTSSSNVGLSLATGATSRWIAVSAGLIFILFAFVPKLAAIFAIMPDPVSGAIVIFVACFMIGAGLQLITSRMIDSRKIFVVGTAMVFGLSVDFFPQLYQNVPAAISPLFSSSLALGTILAVALNLVFRLGVAQQRTLVLRPGTDSCDKLISFLETLGGAWGARREVMNQASAALNEFFQSTSTLGLAEGPITIEVSFDEFNLDIDIHYDGALPSFPDAPPSAETLLTKVNSVADLSGFLIRQSVDRIKADRKGNHCWIQLHFDH
jgi:NCS2 family nucleobase:cation symporter-2